MSFFDVLTLGIAAWLSQKFYKETSSITVKLVCGVALLIVAVSAVY